MIERVVILICNHARCNEEVGPELDAKTARWVAQLRGWSGDLCPKHKPSEHAKCKECAA